MDRQGFCTRCRVIAERNAPGWFGDYLDLNREWIHYVDQGEGPPLILIHGFLAWSYTWRHNLKPLSRHARAVAPDLRGFGLSERMPHIRHRLDDQVELIHAFLQALGIKKAVLCGHSMGGEIALRYALNYPEQVTALILIGASGYVGRPRHPAERWLDRAPNLSKWLIRSVMANRRFAGRVLRSLYWDPDLIRTTEIEAYLVSAKVPRAAETFVRILQDSDFGTSAATLCQVNQRSLLIWGEQDPMIPVAYGRRLASELPASELVVFEQCGHLPHEEQPAAFNRLVSGFLHSL